VLRYAEDTESNGRTRPITSTAFGSRGWTQDKLAEELNIDRRQVVRLESGRAPVTLEVIEALGQVFQEWSITFMWSALDDKEGKRALGRDQMMRLAEQEALSRLSADLNRPALHFIVSTAATLPNEDLDLLAQTALVIFRARAAADSDPGDPVPLWPRLAGAANQGSRRRRARRRDST
jgi:transcriptional regulator with XRE-family HTH domain